MIKIQKMVPEVYYNHSRDFQFLGRTFESIFNYLKMNIDTIYNLPLNEDTDSKWIDLMASTLGFKALPNYNVKQLTAICNCFMTIIHSKGTINSIENAINTILRVSNISSKAIISIDYEDFIVTVYVPMELKDLALLNDLLDYILPAGLSCQLVRTTTENTSASTQSTISQSKNLLGAESQSKSYINTYEEFESGDEIIVPISGTEGGVYDNSVITPYKNN